MHLLQTPHWSAFKSQFGWSAQTIMLDAAHSPTQVLYRQLPLGLNIAYVPKGPDIDWQNGDALQSALSQLIQSAIKATTLFLKIEPDTSDDATVARHIVNAGFVESRTIQPVNTIIVDIADSEDDILSRMKSKTRYNIRLAGRKGVTIRSGSLADVQTFFDLSEVTATRDKFDHHPLAYYQACFNQFSDNDRTLLIAEFEGQPLAGVMIFACGQQAIYLYGASNNLHRNKMPTYLLHWEAIKWAKARGCLAYDLWGIPDASLETLEAEFSNRHDGLWGVYRNKRGFGGRVVRSVGAFDYVPSSVQKRMLHKLFTLYSTRGE